MTDPLDHPIALDPPICPLCSEPFLPGDLTARSRMFDEHGIELHPHAECMLRNVAGHLFGACYCTMPDATVRQQALVAWARAGTQGRSLLSVDDTEGKLT